MAMAATKLPIMQTDDQDMHLMQTRWASIINPVIGAPILQGQLLRSVNLITGDNVINHGLGRNLQGWVVTRLRAPSSLYDTQDSNSMPQLTLNLNSSAPCVADLWVF